MTLKPVGQKRFALNIYNAAQIHRDKDRLRIRRWGLVMVPLVNILVLQA